MATDLRKRDFIGVLSNARGVFDVVRLGANHKITKVEAERLIPWYARIERLPEHEIKDRLSNKYQCIDGDTKDVFIIHSTLSLPEVTKKPIKSISEALQEYLLEIKAQNSFVQEIFARIELMRLFKEGNIALPAYCFYSQSEKGEEPTGIGSDSNNVPAIPYVLSADDAKSLNIFLETTSISSKHEYIKLSYESFQKSYSSEDHIIGFLQLMIAFEALFNDGSSELKYRMSRGAAMLLGEDRKQFQEIFSLAKKLYDKRSVLLHTGNPKGISIDDMLTLRELVRNAIVKISGLGFSKETLSEKLTIIGFEGELTNVR
ncbi:MAG: hypothetical protein L0Y80_08690 [Ignavibacteriae bacterium]|nr:hypothetical protein [Ignavibacteriota bacterium]